MLALFHPLLLVTAITKFNDMYYRIYSNLSTVSNLSTGVHSDFIPQERFSDV
jgi:hypothetical protein